MIKLSAFRGAVTRVGDTYLFPYTAQGSGGFQFCICNTTRIFNILRHIINNV